MRFEKFGWIAAVALAAVLVGSGFQARGDKVGVVDMSRVFTESEHYKRQNEQLRAFGSTRGALLEFVEQNRTFTAEQALRFKELSLKSAATAGEKQELEGIKAAVMANVKKLSQLQTKPSPSAAETEEMQELSRQSNSMTATAQRWAYEFDEELRNYHEQLRGETLQRAKAAVREVAAKQGYNLVFVNEVAPYSANDLTGEALKAMNAKK
jgi:Skp family chaperone for outer membrane proteins